MFLDQEDQENRIDVNKKGMGGCSDSDCFQCFSQRLTLGVGTISSYNYVYNGQIEGKRPHGFGEI